MTHSKMTENVDYQLVPAKDMDGNEAWNVRILKGDYVETVYKYGYVQLASDQIKFDYAIVSSPIEDLEETDEGLQEVVGDILVAVLENEMQKDGTLLKDSQ